MPSVSGSFEPPPLSSVLNPQPVVRALDAAGNLVSSYNRPITLTLEGGPTGATLLRGRYSCRH